MQGLNLIDYVKIYNVFQDYELKNILSGLQKDNIWNRHRWSDTEYNTFDSNRPDELSVTNGNTVENNTLVMNRIHSTIGTYVRDINIWEFDTWAGYTAVRYNRYDPGQTIIKHVDQITDIFTGPRKGSPILSIVGLLNDNFTGGEFIMFDDHKIDLKAGDIMIFPSLFMYPHKVNKVETGVRYSFVSWVW